MLSIPSLEFECEHSSLGGRFTTVEGMLVNVKTELEKSNPFLGDSSTHSKLKDFLEKLSEVCTNIFMYVYKTETRLRCYNSYIHTYVPYYDAHRVSTLIPVLSISH